MKKMTKMKKIGFAILAASPLSTFAAGESGTTTQTISGLWTALGVDIGEQVANVFAAMKDPVGVAITVLFVMTVFYFAVKLAKRAINKRDSM